MTYASPTPSPEWTTVKSSAAKRRAEQAERAEIIAAMAMAQEDPKDRYVHTTGELLVFLNVDNRRAGRPLRPLRIFLVEGVPTLLAASGSLS